MNAKTEFRNFVEHYGKTEVLAVVEDWLTSDMNMIVSLLESFDDDEEEDIHAPISRYCFMCDCWTHTTPITSECVDCGHKKD